MKQMPRKIIVMSQAIPISQVATLVNDGVGCDGVYHPGQGRIEIRSKSTGERALGHESLCDTLLHESIHAILSVSGLKVMFDGEPTEEKFTERLAPLLLSFLRDNPTVVGYLTERIQ
jgi:hypothetical protein